MIAGIGTLSTFVGREQDAHKREEREEGDSAGDQHVEFLQVIGLAPPKRGCQHSCQPYHPVAWRSVA